MKAPSPKNYEGMEKTQKILSLQQQLLNFRKQMSKKQSQWQKQRSNLISKNQVANIQIAELKQRIVNLSKINETLTIAMTNQSDDKYDTKVKKPKPLTFGEDASDSSRESPHGKQGKGQMKVVQEVKKLNRIINEKDFQINNLTKIGSQVRNKLQQKNKIVSSLEESCFHMKRKIQKQQQEILKLHKQIQQLQLHIQQINAEQTRKNNIYFLQNQNKYMENSNSYEEHQLHGGKKYSKNSSYLIMRPTPDNSGSDPDITYFNEINYTEEGQNSEQQEKLLCQVCNRVYSFGQFQEHAKYCGKNGKNGKKPFQGLIERRKMIEQRLNVINDEEIKQNLKGRYQQKFFEGDEYSQNRDKINQIRQIAKGLSSRDLKKTPFNDFTIKSNGYYF